jgi:hypothetical protein
MRIKPHIQKTLMMMMRRRRRRRIIVTIRVTTLISN